MLFPTSDAHVRAALAVAPCSALMQSLLNDPLPNSWDDLTHGQRQPNTSFTETSEHG